MNFLPENDADLGMTRIQSPCECNHSIDPNEVPR